MEHRRKFFHRRVPFAAIKLSTVLSAADVLRAAAVAFDQFDFAVSAAESVSSAQRLHALAAQLERAPSAHREFVDHRDTS